MVRKAQFPMLAVVLVTAEKNGGLEAQKGQGRLIMGYFSLQKQVEGASSGSHWRRDTKRGVKDRDHTVFKVLPAKERHR